MGPTKLSGAQGRKRKKQQEADNVIQAKHWQKLGWVKKVDPSTAALPLQQVIESKPSTSTLLENANFTEVTENITGSASVHSDGSTPNFNPSFPTLSPYKDVQEQDLEDEPTKIQLNFNDPTTWSDLNDHVRSLLVEHGPEQNKNGNFLLSVNAEKRHFTGNWFHKKLLNGESVERNWLIYSEAKKVIYCFPCMLFGKHSKSSLANPKVGFSDWKKLHPRIPEHENSVEHRECYVTWKSFEKRIKEGSTIDTELQQMIIQEKEKWRHILRIIVDCILFCSVNNLAFRGSSTKIGEDNCGIFLHLLEFVSHYDKQLKEYITIAKEKPGIPNYFSPTIQNEFINLIGDTVRQEILKDIREAKYFSISFDCTPDVAHQEQMCQIIRYVKVTEDVCSIEENFIDFIKTSETTGAGLTEEILQKIEADGLDIRNCRGQAYGNGSNMAGKYSGVQARIQAICSHARFMPCAAHSLNLVGVHAAGVSPDVITFFGTVQELYKIFAYNVKRWEILSNKLSTTLKRHCDTRWASKYSAVHALYSQLDKVIEALEEISDNPQFHDDCLSVVKNLMKQINYKFVCYSVVWDKILNQISRVNEQLQRKDVTVDRAVIHLTGLKAALQDIRDTGIDVILGEASDICAATSLDCFFEEKRARKRKRLTLEESEDTVLTGKQRFSMDFHAVLDKVLEQMEWRFKCFSEVLDDFHFLTGKSLQSMTVEELKASAMRLANKCDKDLDATEIEGEIASFKFQFGRIFI